MAELSQGGSSDAAPKASPCCAPEAQATCCTPTEKDECCGPSHEEGCGCSDPHPAFHPTS
jgi:hypothetical protein